VGTRCADHVTPFYPQKLALISPTGGGRSVGIVRVRTKATEFSLVFNVHYTLNKKSHSARAVLQVLKKCLALVGRRNRFLRPPSPSFLTVPTTIFQ